MRQKIVRLFYNGHFYCQNEYISYLQLVGLVFPAPTCRNFNHHGMQITADIFINNVELDVQRATNILIDVSHHTGTLIIFAAL